MTNFSFKMLGRTPKLLNRWFFRTPGRALEQAYVAALNVKAIEDEHFAGQPIAKGQAEHSVSVQAYFEAERDKYLRIVRVRLAEFKTSRSILDLSQQSAFAQGVFSQSQNKRKSRSSQPNPDEAADIILGKLRFIDELLQRYSRDRGQERSQQRSLKQKQQELSVIPFQSSAFSSYQKPREKSRLLELDQLDSNFFAEENKKPPPEQPDGFADSTSFVPRSIFGTFDRLRRELNPQAEQDLVKSFRSSKTKTIVSLRFILLLILVPLLTHQIAKSFVVGPLVDQLRSEEPEAIFINEAVEEEALTELQYFEEKLKFQGFLPGMPKLTAPEIESRMQAKAEEIAEDYRYQGANSIKNVFADILSVGAFLIVLLASKREIAILKSFIDEIIYGLSDSAKAFIIILFTDMFVGFHSPHGWEVILEGVSRHFGLPENREFNFLFIATFPVILDTVFKYWIFRYLNRISPSAVATYRNMNE
ncbi:MAG: proton extrusion protein PcxA [Cyanobacteria bacterium P01_H01_bin.121]